MQLDSPTLEVEFPKGFNGVNVRLEEGGDDKATCGAEAFGSKMDFNNADGEGFWDCGKFVFAHACGRFDGLGPDLEAFVGAELFAFGHIAVAALIEMDDAIDALFFELGKGVEGAKSPVGKENVVFFQKAPQAAEEKGLVNVVVACGKFKQGAACQGEETNEAHERINRGQARELIGVIIGVRHKLLTLFLSSSSYLLTLSAYLELFDAFKYEYVNN